MWQALDEREVEDVETYRTLQYARLEALINVYWGAMLEGDVRATDIILKVMAQEDRLLGLSDRRARVVDDRLRGVFSADWGLKATQEGQRRDQTA